MSTATSDANILNESLLSSLYFTRSTGARTVKNDVTFCDAIAIGGYPSEQKIIKIVRIEIFMSDNTREAVIAGLKVTYKIRGDPATVTVLHGIVTQYIAGVLVVADNELLVGATGRLKNIIDPAKMGRLAFIQFALYNKNTGLTELRGPFGSQEFLGAAWGSYGPILALEGTVWEKDKVPVFPPPGGASTHPGTGEGLTTLGFTKLVQGVPEFGILGHC